MCARYERYLGGVRPLHAM